MSKTFNTVGQKSQILKDLAYSAGFNAVGFAKAEYLESEKEKLELYIEEGRYGQMEYLKNNKEKLLNPFLIFDKLKSVMVLLKSYNPSVKQNSKCSYRVSKYAYGNDYHKVIKLQLKRLAELIKTSFPDVSLQAFVDSGHTLEKAWAQRAGLGWRGKHSLIIHPALGTYFFIAIIFMDMEVDYFNGNIADHCKNCTRCIDACPTKALDPYFLNPLKCISYHNIEKREIGNLSAINNWIYGCDICQDVCPYNKDALLTTEPEFSINSFIKDALDKEWEAMDEISFDIKFRNSAIRRIKYNGLMRNISQVKK